MVDARNANYGTIARHLRFGKRGAPHAEVDLEAQGSRVKPDRPHFATDTLDDGSDSETDAPEPRLLRV
jgi:hypothetical protein